MNVPAAPGGCESNEPLDQVPAGDVDEPAADQPATAVGPPPDRRRLDRIFGDVLPASTRDDLPDPGRESGGTSDDWFYGNRPPHHE